MFRKTKLLPIVVLSFVTSCFVMQDAGAYTPEEISRECEKVRNGCSQKKADQACYSWSDNAGRYAGGFLQENELHKRLLSAWRPCELARKAGKAIDEACKEGRAMCMEGL